MLTAAPLLGAAVNLNQPGRYLHWSIFVVSEANLILIGVMVLIFGLALLLPFPKDRRARTGAAPTAGTANGVQTVTTAPAVDTRDSRDAADIGDIGDTGDPADRSMWTARLRRRVLATFPPNRLLPDRQPAYVASWIYVFGVGALAALGVVIASGVAIAVGGPDWWHTNSVGHFFNSLHLWSVELFMALLVIHLWGKFWMAAWRGKRKWTWISGVVAFLAAVVEAFTGYLSQQNFDSQWIATNGKDAFNAAGVGAFFNLLNFGQMLLWHIAIIPIVLVAIVGAHVLAVRARGVVHPLPVKRAGRPRVSRRTLAKADAAPWRGPTRRYDIVKEGVVASVIVLALVGLLAGLLSSPDVPPVTVRSWAKVAPADFAGTVASELAGTSETATYGPPYNNGTHNVQRIIFSPQTAVGVRQPIDAAHTFVLAPLATVAPTDSALAKALHTYESASPSQQQAWNQAYQNVLTHGTFTGGVIAVPKANDGPVPVLVSTELQLAQNGALDADLITQQPFYGTDFTKPLLFLEDGSYYAQQATAQHLTGTQWGVMNETGSFPGQPWLWLYQLWYQVPGFRTSANVDLIAIYMTGIGTLLLLLVPFIPGLRDIPRWIPVHRLIWRTWNRSPEANAELDAETGGPPSTTPPSSSAPPSTEPVQLQPPVPSVSPR